MKDTADDGLEVYLIRFFRRSPEGSPYAPILDKVIFSYREYLASRKS